MTSTNSKHVRILVINPNSSSSITDDFREPISQLDLPNTSISYWTNLKGPPVIQNQSDIDETSVQCLEPLLQLGPQYDGFLVACYADHTLTAMLQPKLAPKPVVGIFENSITTCHDLLAPGTQFAILTTGKAWEESLTAAVNRLLRIPNLPRALDAFAGVIATGITASILEEKSTEIVKEMLKTAAKQLIRRGNVEIVCLGGVILSNMHEWVREAYVLELGSQPASEIIVMEPVTTGIVSLHKLVHLRC